MLHIRKNFNHDVNQVVWTVERTDGECLFGFVSGLNYDSEEKAKKALPEILKKVQG